MSSSEALVYIVSDQELDADIGEGRDDDPTTSIEEKLRKAKREWGRKFPGFALSIVRVPDPEAEPEDRVITVRHFGPSDDPPPVEPVSKTPAYHPTYGEDGEYYGDISTCQNCGQYWDGILNKACPSCGGYLG